MDASLTVRSGDQVVSVPVASLLEKPQHTPTSAALIVAVERLPWDSLAIELSPAAVDGVVAPGAEIPVSVGLNILWPESSEVSARVSAALQLTKGGEILAQEDLHVILPANRRQPPVRLSKLRAPRVEGTYVLEVRATWESVVRDGSRLGRLIRRHKPAASSSATRRVMLTVLDSSSRPAGTEGGASDREARKGEVEVDSVDLTRARSYRPLASGRSPLAEPGGSAWGVPAEALIEPSRRDLLRGWIFRSGAEAAKLDPADSSGLAWSAVAMKIAHPDRPHRLTLKIKGGEPSSLSVALIEPRDGRTEKVPRVLLDACASGPPILENGPTLSFSWLVWPGSNEAVLVLANRDAESVVRLGSVSLTELDDVPPPPTIREPNTPAVRTLGLYLNGDHALDPFGGGPGPAESLASARNLVKYLAYCGATAVVVPENLADRSLRRSLEGQADEDCTGPDRLEILRRVLARQACSLWLELSFDGPAHSPDYRRPIRRRRSAADWFASTARARPRARLTIRSTPTSARP